MKLHILTICLGLVLSLATAVQAQSLRNPGFLGKTTTLGVTLNFNTAGADHRVHWKGEDFQQGVASGFDLFPGLNLSHCVSKNVGLSVSTEYTRLASRVYSSDIEGFQGSSQYLEQTKAFTLDWGLDLYSFKRKGKIAPIGSYVRLELRTFFVNSRYFPEAVSSREGSPILELDGVQLAPAFSMRKNVIVAPDIIFHMSARLNLLPLDMTVIPSYRERVIQQNVFQLGTGLSCLF